MADQNEIGIENRGNICILDVKGDVTSASEPFFAEAYKHPDVHGISKILVRFDKDAYINSGGIAVLIQLLAETKRNGQEIGITGLSEHFKKIFHMTGITRFADIYPSKDEALGVME